MRSKVLVTGADGFIGSHLVQRLIRNGEEVKAFCMYNSGGSWGWLDTLDEYEKKQFEVTLGDIRDSVCVKEAMKGCDTVYHLAALIAIPYSYIAPASYIDTNIHGTLNVVQAARELGVNKVVHTSTSETYGSAQFVPITEDHPQVGQSPYAASKIGADQIALSYWRSFKTPITILRPFNTYGPRQSARAVIPTIITQIIGGKKLIELGSTTPTRDFNFVWDTCDAFIALAKSKETVGKIVNSASSFEISIKQTAELIADILNKEIEIKSINERTRPTDSEVNRLYGDNSLMKELTDWRPQFGGVEGFRRGLSITAEWFSEPENLKNYRREGYII